MKYNTLDLDLNTRFLTLNFGFVEPKDFFMKVIYKVSQCKHGEIIYVSPSNSKGVHVKIICDKECDICRLVFDHQKRFIADMTRRKHFSNIMFDDKSL